MNMKNLFYSIVLFIGAGVGVYCLLTKEFHMYNVIGTIIFLFAGFGFLKRVRD